VWSPVTETADRQRSGGLVALPEGFPLLSTGSGLQWSTITTWGAGRSQHDSTSTCRAQGHECLGPAREERIQILQWANSDESLRLLQAHQGYRHIGRMVSNRGPGRSGGEFGIIWPHRSTRLIPSPIKNDFA